MIEDSYYKLFIELIVIVYVYEYTNFMKKECEETSFGNL